MADTGNDRVGTACRYREDLRRSPPRSVVDRARGACFTGNIPTSAPRPTHPRHCRRPVLGRGHGGPRGPGGPTLRVHEYPAGATIAGGDEGRRAPRAAWRTCSGALPRAATAGIVPLLPPDRSTHPPRATRGPIVPDRYWSAVSPSGFPPHHDPAHRPHPGRPAILLAAQGPGVQTPGAQPLECHPRSTCLSSTTSAGDAVVCGTSRTTSTWPIRSVPASLSGLRCPSPVLSLRLPVDQLGRSEHFRPPAHRHAEADGEVGVVHGRSSIAPPKGLANQHIAGCRPVEKVLAGPTLSITGGLAVRDSRTGTGFRCDDTEIRCRNGAGPLTHRLLGHHHPAGSPGGPWARPLRTLSRCACRAPTFVATSSRCTGPLLVVSLGQAPAVRGPRGLGREQGH